MRPTSSSSKNNTNPSSSSTDSIQSTRKRKRIREPSVDSPAPGSSRTTDEKSPNIASNLHLSNLRDLYNTKIKEENEYHVQDSHLDIARCSLTCNNNVPRVLTPALVMEVIGVDRFLKVRSAMQNQKRDFLEQVAQLHDLVNVQKLLRQEILLSEAKPSESLKDTVPANEASKEVRNGETRARFGLNQGFVGPRRQYLVPVMSMFEGLVYKPYPATSFPLRGTAPTHMHPIERNAFPFAGAPVLSSHLHPMQRSAFPVANRPILSSNMRIVQRNAFPDAENKENSLKTLELFPLKPSSEP